jgi:hypothetical protein
MSATFQRLFPVFLTDNDCEFTKILKLEFDDQNNRRTRIFYCDKSSPHLKGGRQKTTMSLFVELFQKENALIHTHKMI